MLWTTSGLNHRHGKGQLDFTDIYCTHLVTCLMRELHGTLANSHDSRPSPLVSITTRHANLLKPFGSRSRSWKMLRRRRRHHI